MSNIYIDKRQEIFFCLWREQKYLRQKKRVSKTNIKCEYAHKNVWMLSLHK